MTNVTTLHNETKQARIANKHRAISIACDIAAQSDTSALMLLDKAAKLYSAAFLAIVYTALESLQ